ncbi:MAG: rhomboid family intramembrane serine protease [Ignavibacteriae bacterium]|nr:rhomboid family intramembrane serine protease [Ignavibacteriota bacterium]
MMPLGDDNTDRTTRPIVTYTLIAINIVVFVLFQGLGSNNSFTMAFSTVPAEIVSGNDIITEDQIAQDPQTGQTFELPGLEPTPITVYITLLTSMFMHGGLGHIFGNMLYLWIFGDNIEDRMGHARYLVFYLLTGVLASLAHVFSTYAFNGNPLIPSLGASGAISGVLGGYLLLFPGKRVKVLMFTMLTEVPSIVAIGLWFAFQLLGGFGSISGAGGGVAYAAHIGGFIAGLILVKVFDAGKREPGVFVGRTR